MTELEKELYDICKSLEEYSGYTEGVISLVEDSTEDMKSLVDYYKRHPDVTESDFLWYASILNIRRYEPERLYEDGISVEVSD